MPTVHPSLLKECSNLLNESCASGLDTEVLINVVYMTADQLRSIHIGVIHNREEVCAVRIQDVLGYRLVHPLFLIVFHAILVLAELRGLDS